MKINEYLQKVKNREISIVKNTKKILDEAKKANKKYNFFTVISEDLALELAEKQEKNPHGKLSGLPVQ